MNSLPVVTPVRTHDRTHKGKPIDMSGDRTVAMYPSTQGVGGIDGERSELSMGFEYKSSIKRHGLDNSSESQVDDINKQNEPKKSESETLLLMSSSFLQFAPSLVTEARVTDGDKRSVFNDSLHDSLARFGLNKLAIEKRHFCVALVNSVNVRNTDSVSVHNSEPINVRNDEPLPVFSDEDQLPNVPQTGKDRSPKPLHRRKRKSGAVLCLMPLPDDAISTCESYRTSRSAPAILGDQRFSARTSQNAGKCEAVEFHLAPRDPLSTRFGNDLHTMKSHPPLAPTAVAWFRHENSADSGCPSDIPSSRSQPLTLSPDMVALPLFTSDRADASRFGFGRNSRSNTRPSFSGQRTHETQRVSPISPKSEKKGMFKKLFSNQGKCSSSHDALSSENGLQTREMSSKSDASTDLRRTFDNSWLGL